MNVGGPKVSIVIRCHNEAEHIGKLFAELKRQTFTDYEVVVVDSGSDDGTLDIVTSEDVILEHIRKEDFSFGRSLNLGCTARRRVTSSFSSPPIATRSTRSGWPAS